MPYKTQCMSARTSNKEANVIAMMNVEFLLFLLALILFYSSGRATKTKSFFFDSLVRDCVLFLMSGWFVVSLYQFLYSSISPTLLLSHF